MTETAYPYVPAKWKHVGGNTPITRIVIHDAEYPEKITGAEDVAAYFQHVTRQASAHAVSDCDSTVECVHDEDTAFHAPPNRGSLGLELCGYAKQLTGDWLDDYGVSMLRDQAAPWVRAKAAKHGVPLVWLSVADLLAGKHGITSHNNVSLAWHQSTHTDPGGNFPVQQFMAWVALGPNQGAQEMKQVFYKVSVDPGNSQSAPGDEGIWTTTDSITTHLVSGAAWAHAKNLGWWDESNVIFIPKSIHDWLVTNTRGGNTGD